LKNQYFGDINDYFKYGLLRKLVGEDLRIVVVWMLTPNDGRSDGRHTTYLKKPQTYRSLDPPLFDALLASVDTGQRNVDVVKHVELVPHATYYSPMLTDDLPSRQRYFRELWSQAANRSLLFFDPDNGLEIMSIKKGRRGSSRYLYLDEVALAWQSGHSVLLYQHFPRVERSVFISKVADALERATGVVPMMIGTGRVLFILLAQEAHWTELTHRAEDFASRWSLHLSAPR
jgi:hypothetical protein